MTTKRTTRRTPADRLTIEHVERVIGLKAASWSGRCYEIASRIVMSGLVTGTAVYGHWLGKIHPQSVFKHKRNIGFCQHGWVLLADGRVFDPTRWAFEARKPYLFIGPGDTQEYDEGGNQIRSARLGSPPAYDPDEKTQELTKKMLPSQAWNHVEHLLRIDIAQQEPGKITMSQLHWLANADYDMLQPYAVFIYGAIKVLGREGLIPIDNARRAERQKKSRRQPRTPSKKLIEAVSYWDGHDRVE